jgi:hypothetical protein
VVALFVKPQTGKSFLASRRARFGDAVEGTGPS